MNAARTPWATRRSTWSFINAIKGETTIVRPSLRIAGTQ
jgi:hypothetical protein